MKKAGAPGLRLCWLGHARIELCGRLVRLETRKTTALLAYLSLMEYPQSREKLATLFWPEFHQSGTPANLRRTIASLHASLPGSDWFRAERDSLSVRSQAWVDALTVRRLVAELKARQRGFEEPEGEQLKRVDEAIGLFQGEFLEGLNLPGCPEFDDRQMVQREDLRLELGWLLEKSAWGHAAFGDRN